MCYDELYKTLKTIFVFQIRVPRKFARNTDLSIMLLENLPYCLETTGDILMQLYQTVCHSWFHKSNKSICIWP